MCLLVKLKSDFYIPPKCDKDNVCLSREVFTIDVNNRSSFNNVVLFLPVLNFQFDTCDIEFALLLCPEHSLWSTKAVRLVSVAVCKQC